MAGARELVVEADGGSRGNPGPAGYGALVRDAASGALLAERAGYLGETTNNVAEYTGLLEGLRAASAVDPRARVHVRMDSRLVVEQMTGAWQIKHPALREIAVRARAVFPAGQVTYEWIPRAENSAADALANEAMDSRAPAIVRDFPGSATGVPATGSAATRAAATGESGTRAAATGEPGEAAGGAVDPATGGAGARAVATGESGTQAAVREPGEAAGSTVAPAIGSAGAPAAATGEPGETLGVPGEAAGGAVDPATGSAGARAVATGEPGETLGVPADAGTGAPVAGAAGPPSDSREPDQREPDRRKAAPPEEVWRPAGAFAGLDQREALTLVLVRHGVTPLTVAGGLSGGEVPGPALTAQGRTQAARAADAIFRLRELWPDLPRPTHLVTSPMVRTQEVAAAVGRRLGLSPEVDERLREMEFGEWESLTPGQVEERWPGDFARWFSTGTFAPPGGESYEQVGERVAVAIEDLRTRLAGNAVVAVGHAAMIRTVAGRALDMPPSSWSRLRIPPCSLTILRYFPATTEVVTVGHPT